MDTATFAPAARPQVCAWCDEAVEDSPVLAQPRPSGGLPDWQSMHRECRLRMIAGGANHQLGLCTCCGGIAEPDPAGLTKREAAVLAASIYRRRRAAAGKVQ